MKLSDYARQAGVSYKTAWRWWKAGVLTGYQLPSGTIVIDSQPEQTRPLNREVCQVSDSTATRLAGFETKLEALQASLHQAAIERSHLLAELEAAKRDRAELLTLVQQLLRDLQSFNFPSPARWPSEVGMDYTHLETLLAEGKWREADEYTWLLLLAITQQETAGCLGLEDVAGFPQTDLQTIDRLWVDYSGGLFGLSIQLEIFASVEYAYPEFCDRVGWRVRQKWLYYDELNFSLNAPAGHLPVCVWRKRSCYGVGFVSAADSAIAFANRLLNN
ncbi:MAG: hypothetical protein F6K32_04595 [Desertifilum sp. SIO1I2]|nr:hypothetical protein [Desertifilum sp. SIO1I2]